jgi:hypothetical protein
MLLCRRFLYTVSNLGWAWPRFAVFALTDRFGHDAVSKPLSSQPASLRKGLIALCCVQVAFGCCVAGCLLWPLLSRSMRRVQSLPPHAWRAKAADLAT